MSSWGSCDPTADDLREAEVRDLKKRLEESQKSIKELKDWQDSVMRHLPCSYIPNHTPNRVVDIIESHLEVLRNLAADNDRIEEENDRLSGEIRLGEERHLLELGAMFESGRATGQVDVVLRLRKILDPVDANKWGLDELLEEIKILYGRYRNSWI